LPELQLAMALGLVLLLVETSMTLVPPEVVELRPMLED
jgi:hypothetical protein